MQPVRRKHSVDTTFVSVLHAPFRLALSTSPAWRIVQEMQTMQSI